MRGTFHALLTLMLCIAMPARAAVTPTPGPEDPRIQTVNYSPNQVVLLDVTMGYTLTIEFEADEQIRNVAVGNGAVWQVTTNQAADHIFVKPLLGAVSTNLTVVTDSRLYNFQLEPSFYAGSSQAFVVRFEYPVEEPADNTIQASDVTYKFVGSSELRPKDVFDDGERTYIEWPEKIELPATFIVDGNGKESLINGSVRDGVHVIEGVGQRLIFRLGKDEAMAIRRVNKGR